MPTRQRRIRANISPLILDQVSRFFDTTPENILNELLQNARRSGASHVHVTLTPLPGHETLVRIADDGSGIADLALLLSYGASEWSDPEVRDEDPAGMGILSLATRNCRIRSATPDTHWTVNLEPAHFNGKKDAVVTRMGAAPAPGTTIEFRYRGHACLADATRNAAHYYPLPVHLTTCPLLPSGRPGNPKTELLPHDDFLPGTAIATAKLNGVRFAVLTGRYRHQADGKNLNFHGIRVKTDLPSLNDCENRSWNVVADVARCNGLEFTLPARDRLVDNHAARRMRHDATAVILRTMRDTPDTYPNFASWSKARELGIEMEIPPPRLKPWTAHSADPNGNFVNPEPPRDLPPDAIRVDGTTALLDQHIAHALHYGQTSQPLFESNPLCSGFPWYNKLPVLSACHARIVASAASGAPFRPIEHGLADASQAPHALRFELPVLRAGLQERRIALPTNLAAIPDPEDGWYPELDHVSLRTTRDDAPEFFAVTDFLEQALFCPDDSEGSYYEQRDEFRREAHALAARTMFTGDEIQKSIIRNAFLTHLSTLVTAERPIQIRSWRDPEKFTLHVEIELQSPAPAPAAATG